MSKNPVVLENVSHSINSVGLPPKSKLGKNKVGFGGGSNLNRESSELNIRSSSNLNSMNN